MTPRGRVRRSRPAGTATAAALVALALVAFAAAPASAAPANFVGLQDWKPLTAEKFGRLDRANVHVWRNIFVWNTVESERGTYKWDRYDRMFADAAANNVRILPILIGSPKWANWKPQLPPKNADTRRRFYKFSEAAVARYGPHGEFWRGKPYPRSVRAVDWEVWNEPNLRNYWGKVDPRAYGNFLRLTSAAANRADPDVRIVSGGLYTGGCSAGMCVDDFVRGMFSVDGVEEAVDAVAIHPYTAKGTDGVFDWLDVLRREIRRATGSSKRLMITEFGWSTSGSHYTTVSRDAQARLLNSTFRELIARRHEYRLTAAIWFGFKDLGGDSWQNGTGLFDQEGRIKPSWRKLVEVTDGRL